ncbi:ABC transporter permease [bacterium]|nr:ABC transporter permease [bacterium]
MMLKFFHSSRRHWLHSPVIGDLREEYRLIASEKGRRVAMKWIVRQIVITFLRLLSQNFIWSLEMLKSYIKTAIRNFRRQRTYTLINLTGLIVGMAACLLIAIYIQDDLNYDHFHVKKDRIYRIYIQTIQSGQPWAMAPTMLPLAPALKEGFPEIDKVARILQKNHFPFGVDGEIFKERLYFVDPDILNILTLPLISGDIESALSKPNSLIITSNMASRFYGDENPIGRIIELDRGNLYTVTGVFGASPGKSHLRTAAMASIVSQMDTPRLKNPSWSSFQNDYTYVLLKSGVSPEALQAKFQALWKEHITEEDLGDDELRLQSLTDIHFSQLNYDNAQTSNRNSLIAAGVVGFFILAIACFNFINLTTARISGRMKEVGVRKVAGADRGQLLRQYLTESTLLSIIAMGACILITCTLLPPFSRMMNRNMSIDPMLKPGILLLLFGISVLIGLLAGLYPALRLSGIQPMAAFRNIRDRHGSAFSLRTVLVVAQFAISIFLIIATLTVQRQRQFMLHRSLGFEHDQIIALNMQNSPIYGRTDAMKTTLLSHPGILSASLSHSVPGSGISITSGFHVIGEERDEIPMNEGLSDFDFVETLGLTMVAGRDFSEDYATDFDDALIINETAMQHIGWSDPLGRRLDSGDKAGQVIGVVKDFHFSSMHEKIRPMVFSVNTESINFITIRIHPQQISNVLKFLEETWNDIAPGYPFRPHFFDEQFERYYRQEARLTQLFSLSAGLAILISCLGMIALAAHVVAQRLKEIGIRKVLGASIYGLIRLLTVDFIKWVVIAGIIASPAAYFIMRRWLSNYAYRTSIPIWLMLLSALMAVLIACLAIGTQTIKATFIQPAQILKDE